MSVVVPVYNRLELLRNTVSSLSGQTLNDAEFILVDDSSDPETVEYLISLEQNDNRFTVCRKPDAVPKGPQASRNIGLDATTADAIVFLDSDDFLTPQCLEDRVAQLAAAPHADMLVGRQAIHYAADGSRRWVNIPRPGSDDLDRFVDLAHPLDVPWVNAGVTIRTQTLREAGVRWRPEFDWDDVAFHFECLTRGLTTHWMDFSRPPDSFYYKHGKEHYGRSLFTREGILNAAAMIFWMAERLESAEMLTSSRRRSLVTSFFHACVLRAIDMGNRDLARELIERAAKNRLVADAAPKFGIYEAGRKMTSGSSRLTYYWNRFARRFVLSPWYSDRPSSYASLPATAIT